MTDKQIIIDGCDVSKCEYYDDLDCYSNRYCCGYPEECKEKPNCYYKQLKRKEQECEELKVKLRKYKDNEQQEKEIQKLYNKFEGSSLIEKSITNEQRP